MATDDLGVRIWMAVCAGLVFLANLLWLGCKLELRARGHRHSWFNHFANLVLMHKLIREEDDPERRFRSTVLLYSIYVSVLLSVLLFLSAPLAWTPGG